MIAGTRRVPAMSGSHSFAASRAPSGIGIQQSSVSVYRWGKRVMVFTAYLRMTRSGSQVAMPGNAVMSPMASTISPKNGSDAHAT